MLGVFALFMIAFPSTFTWFIPHYSEWGIWILLSVGLAAVAGGLICTLLRWRERPLRPLGLFAVGFAFGCAAASNAFDCLAGVNDWLAIVLIVAPVVPFFVVSLRHLISPQAGRIGGWCVSGLLFLRIVTTFLAVE